jgi:hypothetical protein
MEQTVLYRYDAYNIVLKDGVIRLRVGTFSVIKETPGGYWIKVLGARNNKKWVSKYARKRFAYPTEKEAFTSYRARKRRQIEILEARLEQAKEDFFLQPEHI